MMNINLLKFNTFELYFMPLNNNSAKPISASYWLRSFPNKDIYFITTLPLAGWPDMQRAICCQPSSVMRSIHVRQRGQRAKQVVVWRVRRGARDFLLSDQWDVISHLPLLHFSPALARFCGSVDQHLPYYASIHRQSFLKIIGLQTYTVKLGILSLSKDLGSFSWNSAHWKKCILQFGTKIIGRICGQ